LVFWSSRIELSHANRLRRSYYELLRDDLDHLLIDYSLIQSYNKFVSKNIEYPFVEKRELKPRARIPDREYGLQNALLVIFVEDSIPAIHKKYIRFFDINKTTKTNLLKSKSLPLNGIYDRTQKYLDSVHFVNFLQKLLPIDYALLLQRNPTSRGRDRYSVSHFHVRIDWPIAEASENLAQYLRYISKDLYEKGDKYAEDIQKKFFEYYGLPGMAGGRRTAAIVAAQYLRRLNCISTVYAGSSESRALIRISEAGVSKFVLMNLELDELTQIAANNNLTINTFKKNYVVSKNQKEGVCLFHVTYSPSSPARPPEDGKLRELKPDLSWLRVSSQHLIPKPGVWKYPPLPVNMIYST
jgi:hypothetical protein